MAFWKSTAKLYLILPNWQCTFVLFRYYSVACECWFYIGGQIISGARNRSNGDTSQAPVYLKSWILAQKAAAMD